MYSKNISYYLLSLILLSLLPAWEVKIEDLQNKPQLFSFRMYEE